jgi:hypothetical protein
MDASAFVFEPHHGRVTGKNLGSGSSFPHPVRGLADDRMVFDQSSNGVKGVPIGHALFKLLHNRISSWAAHVRSLAAGSRKRNRRFVLAHAGGNA